MRSLIPRSLELARLSNCSYQSLLRPSIATVHAANRHERLFPRRSRWSIADFWNRKVKPAVIKSPDASISAPGSNVEELAEEHTEDAVDNEAVEDFEPAGPFKVGSKPIYLPDFTIGLMRTPKLPPTFARFSVPLSFNKLDMRDYMYHVYGVLALRVQSKIIYKRVQQDKSSARRPRPRRWHRPKPSKQMLIEMDKPFIWPDTPEDMKPYEQKEFETEQMMQEDYQARQSGAFKGRPDKVNREKLREQAQDLLSGKTTWRPQWQEDGQQPRYYG